MPIGVYLRTDKYKQIMSNATKKAMTLELRQRIASTLRSPKGQKQNRGYVLIYSPNHPRADEYGYVKRAVLVLEQKLGRYLLREEVPHHINGIRGDDRPENLEVFASNSKHARYHAIKSGLGTHLWRVKNGS